MTAAAGLSSMTILAQQFLDAVRARRPSDTFDTPFLTDWCGLNRDGNTMGDAALGLSLTERHVHGDCA